jgi:Uma2 family endonuclease
MSVSEWVKMPEDEPGELIDGQLVEEEVPDLVHETVVSWLIGLLRAWIIPRGGFVFGSEGKFIIGVGRGRKPDLTVFFPGGKVLPRRGGVRIPPDIAVEVISPTPRDRRRDRIEKPDDYAGFGVRYYWMIDPEQRSLEVLELGSDGRYVRALGAVSGQLDRVPGCEGLVLNLDELWAEIERLGPEAPEDEAH